MTGCGTLRLVGALDTARERYLRIVKDFRSRLSQAETGKKVGGLSQAQISFYENGTNQPDLRAIALVMDALHIRSEYFFDATLADPDWRQFVGPEAAGTTSFDWQRFVRAEDPDAWRRFAERHLDRFVAEGMTEHQIESLRGLEFRGGPPIGPGAYVDHAEIMIRRPEGTVPAGAARAKREQAKHGGKVKAGKP